MSRFAAAILIAFAFAALGGLQLLKLRKHPIRRASRVVVSAACRTVSDANPSLCETDGRAVIGAPFIWRDGRSL